MKSLMGVVMEEPRGEENSIPDLDILLELDLEFYCSCHFGNFGENQGNCYYQQ